MYKSVWESNDTPDIVPDTVNVGSEREEKSFFRTTARGESAVNALPAGASTSDHAGLSVMASIALCTNTAVSVVFSAGMMYVNDAWR